MRSSLPGGAIRARPRPTLPCTGWAAGARSVNVSTVPVSPAQRSLAALALCLACNGEPGRPLPRERPAPTDGWVAFSSEPWGFRADFPAPPQTEVMKLPTPLGELDMHIFGVDRGAHAFMLSVLDRPPGGDTDPQRLLDGSRDGILADLGGRLVREEQLVREGLPARRLQISSGAGGQAHRVDVLLVLRELRLYQVVVTAPADRPNPPQAERFFASLHVTQ